MSKVNFEHLFAPLQVGPMTVRNRICETTNTINSLMLPGQLNDNFIAHQNNKLYTQLKADGGIDRVFIAGSAWLPRHMAEATPATAPVSAWPFEQAAGRLII